MTGPITIEKLELTGFRAYLKPQTFQLRGRSSPFSLAVFAPNGIGKSSLVDSLEYYFSKDGTLKRLGQRSSSTQAGLGAVRHVDAEERNVETSVSIRFRQGIDKFGGPRPFSVPAHGCRQAGSETMPKCRLSFAATSCASLSMGQNLLTGTRSSSPGSSWIRFSPYRRICGSLNTGQARWQPTRRRPTSGCAILWT